MPLDRLWETLNSGDWACAHADPEGLVRIASSLSRLLDGDMERCARRVAFLAEKDMSTATLLWGELAGQIRALREHARV
jgi:hypothetical protein